MRNDWLKTIGEGHRPCPDPYNSPHVAFRSKKPKGIRPGDRLVLYAAGGKKTIFALAEVTSGVYASGDAEWPHRIDVKYIVNVGPSAGVPVEKMITENRDLRNAICRQHSHIRLTASEFAKAERLLIPESVPIP